MVKYVLLCSGEKMALTGPKSPLWSFSMVKRILELRYGECEPSHDAQPVLSKGKVAKQLRCTIYRVD